ncbi:MAG: Transcriptional regulator, AcrR family [uncultured Ramlibacter sp.]|uniref:Transcriptional regulator, AcrR family n=1 Tax=uncultured Ramlibacter sp. TaxID=260755 RepID=A0A6J4NFD4_9BURK|nr:MAG: Transcriptional regulator, AcrR family [uncultured Ramlibacter sp.]
MPPLPPSLAAVFQAALGGGAKRERTQVQLVQAAVRVFAERGVPAATVQEVAQVAGVTAGTFYNHFRTKDELLARVALVLADSLSHAINGSYAQVKDGAERMAIGQRRYVWLAAQSPQWALLLLDVLAARPSEFEAIQGYVLADLRLGLKQKRFKVASEAAALDAIAGTCTFAMRRVALGLAPANHDIATATTVLRALGMAQDEAAAVARRPLPELGTGST